MVIKMTTDKQKLNFYNKKIKDYTTKSRPYIDKKIKLQGNIDLETNKKLLGKCFKYHNSYNNVDKWWLYLKIVSYDSISVFIIQIEKIDNEIECKMSSLSPSNFNRLSNYIPISNEEFDLTFKTLHDKLLKVSGVK